MRRLASTIAATAASGLLLFPALGAAGASPPPGAAALARAEALAQKWGRCPTARRAHRLLAIAEATTAPKPRARRARAALRAWTDVAHACSQPVDQPAADPGA
jgi:hypothetical protein